MDHHQPLDPRQLGSPERLQRLEQLRDELQQARCRTSFLAFATHALRPRNETPARHHRLIIRELEDVVHGRTPRLILIAPRGSAKTSYTSHLLPAWHFALRPGTTIVGVSHTQEFAEQNSRTIQRYVRENERVLGYRLINDAAGRWETSNGCMLIAVGVGQAIRGRRADIILVDDPIRSRAEAESETSRNSLWEFFHSDLVPCLKPGGGVVLIATAYHELDLMCRLEREQASTWKVLRLSAISEGADIDPLGRPEGEPLWPESKFGAEKLVQLQWHIDNGRMRDWHAQFQGHPYPPEGALFRPAEMPIFDVLPAFTEEVRAWDLASTVKGDWTVGLRLSRPLDWNHYKDMLIVTDIRRMRGTPDEVRHLVQTVAQSDGYGVKQWFPEDPGQAGKDQVQSYIKLLSGYRVEAERMTGDKVTRADACASQANIGQIGMLKASWNASLIDELASFPSGRWDDQTDALSLAFSKLSGSDLSIWARM
jgi:predicted phage terminase large subunit-like protein